VKSSGRAICDVSAAEGSRSPVAKRRVGGGGSKRNPEKPHVASQPAGGKIKTPCLDFTP